MDDDELGRPPRHERKRKAGDGGWATNMLGAGEKDTVRVVGHAVCACGRRWDVEFEGPEDSMGVGIARAALAEPLCEECRVREEGLREAAEAERERVELIRSRVETSGVPEPWRALTFDRLERKREQEEALAAARGWAAGSGSVGVVLHGDVGQGKTVIAAAAAIERCALGVVRWIGVAKLLTELRMPFDSPEYARAVRRLDPGRRGAALVLDDLDKLKPTEHSLQPLYVAINGWLEARQPLLVTMNRDLDSLAEWCGPTFGDALASRLAGYCDVVELSGPDWRLAA